MKIGLYGGAFNPIHIGHLEIAKWAIKELELDKIIFIPGYIGPFKKNKKFVDGIFRKEMIELELQDKMEVSSFELDKKGTSYTIETIKYFYKKFSKDDIFLLIGSDNLSKLGKWKEIDEISKLVKIAIFRRSKNINKTNIKKYNGILLHNPLYEQSSTRFLKGQFNDVSDLVRKYIGNKQIYFENILKNILSEKRYIHSLNAGKYGAKIAKALNYDVKKAYFSSLVHDIAKEIPENEAREIIKKYEPQNEHIDKYKLHQELGYVLLKYIFYINEEIANSVRVHTSLSLELSLLDKIVFMADKLCQGRKWNGIQKIRQLAMTNFDKSFSLVVQQTWKFNKEKGNILSKEQEEIYKKWTNNI